MLYLNPQLNRKLISEVVPDRYRVGPSIRLRISNDERIRTKYGSNLLVSGCCAHKGMFTGFSMSIIPNFSFSFHSR